VNAAVQYEARSISEEEGKKMQESEEFSEFVTEATPRYHDTYWYMHRVI